jgi:hypothetical protein
MGVKLGLSILRVFENRVLRRIFGPKREEVAGGWRRLHNEELHNLFTLPNVTRVFRSSVLSWAGDVTLMGEMRNAYKIFAGKPEGKRPFGRSRRRLEDNIRMDLTVGSCELDISGSG